MQVHSSTWARKNFFNLLKHTVESNDPTIITGKIGDAVLLAKEDYDAIMETLYIHSIPGLAASILAADKNNPDEWVEEDELEW